MKRNEYSYMLRILRRDPYQETLDRMAEYFRVLSDLLGRDNNPTFAGVVKKSVGVRARIPDEFQDRVERRMTDAANDGAFDAAEQQLARLHVRKALLLDSDGNVRRELSPKQEPVADDPRLYQHGTVDGVITGLVGADDTMHLYIRDIFDRKVTLVVRDIHLAKELLQHFRTSEVRLQVEGTWRRTEDGWLPESNKCTVRSFDALDESPASKIFDDLRSIPGNGWAALEDPLALWRDIRGIES